MEVWSSYYFDGKTDGSLKFYHSKETNKMGIQNLETGLSVPPFLDHIITCGDYILIQIDGQWGILDNDFHMVLPPIFNSLYPVKQIDRDAFVSSCIANTSPFSKKSFEGMNKPSHFIVQEKEKVDRCLYYEEVQKDAIYEILGFEEHTTLFVVASEKDCCLIELIESKFKHFNTHSREEISQIYHYYKDVFFLRDIRGNFAYGTFENGRLQIRKLYHVIVRNKYSVSQKYCPNVIIYKNEFVAFQLSALFDYDDGQKLPASDKWAIFKLKDNYFEQLTPFALDDALLQTTNPFLFICRIEDNSFFVKYIEEAEDFVRKGKEESECSIMLNDYRKTKSNLTLLLYKMTCFRGKMLASLSNYKKISCREDGMFDFYTKEGCGLINDKQEIIIPAIYDKPVEYYGPFMIVSKKCKTGLVDGKGKELIPCKYDCIQVGSDEISVWKRDSEYNYDLCESEEWDYFDNEIGCFSFDEDLNEKSILLLGINNKESNGINVAQCDIYLQDGEYLFTCEIYPSGGVRYYKVFDAILVYREQDYDENNISFYGGVRFFVHCFNELTPNYEQASFIDKQHFFAYKEQNTGVVRIKGNDDEKLEWIVPCEYEFITFPVNNLLYAVCWNGKSQRLDVIDIEDNFNKIYSMELLTNDVIDNRRNCLETLFSGVAIDDEAKNNLAERIVGKGDIDKLVCFPYQSREDDDYYRGYPDDYYSIEDSLRDAFDDEPEAMWGIMY